MEEFGLFVCGLAIVLPVMVGALGGSMLAVVLAAVVPLALGLGVLLLA